MAKRSREDFDSTTPEPRPIGDTLSSDASIQTTSPKERSVKIIHLGELHLGSGVETLSSSTQMLCSLPPHRQTLSFASYEEYELHYNKTHVNRCLECRKNFPTEHFLNLHIEENHDALVSVRRERGDKTVYSIAAPYEYIITILQYACFVEDCDRPCSTPQKRRMHLMDKHLFPKDYDFYIVDNGIDNRTSMLISGRHRRRSSATQHMTVTQEKTKRRESIRGNAPDIGEEAPRQENSDVDTPPSNSQEDPTMDSLSSAMSSLKFVPPSVRFGRGRGRGRGGFSKT